MRRNVAGPIALLVVCVAMLPQPAAAVTFPDKALEAALRYQILEKRDKPDELTEDDLKKVFILEAKGKGIKDLTGIEKCVNVQLINFAKNEITDVSLLKGLKNLQSLDLANNQITDVSPLTELTALQFLELSNNQISDIKPLATLVKLATLDVSGNKVTDVSPLAELKKLASLHLAKNQITDVKPLEGLTGLSLLKLSDNQISDVTPLQKMNNLRMLFLERNKLQDLAPLVASCKADAEKDRRFAPYLRLYLADNPLSDAAKDEQLAALKSAGVKVEPQPVKKAFIDGTGPGWVALTGDDFEHVNCAPETWTWNGGDAHCTGQPVGVTRTKKKYTNLELVAEWRHLKSAGNSGIFLWAPDEAFTDLKPNALPKGGIEIQILDHGYAEQWEKKNGKKSDWFTTNGDVFPVGTSKMNPFAPVSANGSRSFPRKELSKGINEWNHYYVRAINGEVRLWVNGEEVSGGANCEPRTGYLCLESEGSPIDFRNIRIRELP